MFKNISRVIANFQSHDFNCYFAHLKLIHTYITAHPNARMPRTKNQIRHTKPWVVAKCGDVLWPISK